MSLKAAIQSAVQTALYHNNKVYDQSQIMTAVPYGFSTPALMRDLLLDISHELASDSPPIQLNVNGMDYNRCMNGSVNDLQAYIYATVSP